MCDITLENMKNEKKMSYERTSQQLPAGGQYHTLSQHNFSKQPGLPSPNFTPLEPNSSVIPTAAL